MSENKAFKTEIEAVFQPKAPNKMTMYNSKIGDAQLEGGEKLNVFVTLQGNIAVVFGNSDKVTFTVQELLQKALEVREQYKTLNHDNK